MRDALSTLDQVLAFCGETVADEEVADLLGVVDRQLLVETSLAVFARDSRAVLEIVKRVDSFGYNMRQFCQELIEHFRSMTVVRAVDDAAELLDLAARELAELKEQTAGVELGELQRHLAILLKAEADMPNSTFPRLILEMALLKMAALRPVMPIRELLDRLKALEDGAAGSAVASPPPVWEKAAPRTSSADPSPAPKREPAAHPVSHAPKRAEPERQAAPSAMGGNAQTGESWPVLVAFIKGKKPMLASLLEHGRPLNISPGLLEIGYPAGSFHLSRFKDPEAIAEFKGLVEEFFKAVVAIRIVSLEDGGGDVPLSLQEKKSLEETTRRRLLREEVAGHPLVAAAVEIFGGEIGEVREVAADEQVNVSGSKTVLQFNKTPAVRTWRK
jgi:DNA polymerase-3 subunit gamma/tau